MQYFHAKGVLQVDMGLHNLLVDWDDNVKYCDFSGSSIDGSRPTVVVSPTAQHPKACSCSSLHFSSVLELYSGPQAVVINPGHAGFYV